MVNDLLKGLTPQVQAEFEALRRTYVAGLQKRLEEMQQARHQQDWLALALCAHRLRGSAAGYGFQALSDMARHLEEACSAVVPADVDAAVLAVHQEIEQVKRAI